MNAFLRKTIEIGLDFWGISPGVPWGATAALVLAECRQGLLGSELGLCLSLAAASQEPGEH